MVHPLLRSVLLLVVAEGFYSAAFALVQGVAPFAPQSTILFVQFTVCLCWTLFWALLGGTSLRPSRLRLQLLCAGCAVANCFLLCLAVRTMPLATATGLNRTLALLTPVVAWVWLRRRILAWQWMGLLAGFVGVLLIASPNPGHVWPGGVLALGSGLCAAIALLAIQRLGHSEPTLRILFYIQLLGTCTTAPLAVAAWTPLPVGIWCTLLLIGLFSALFQTCIVRGLSLATTPAIGVIAYLGVLFSAVADLVIWDREPAAWLPLDNFLGNFLGALLVVGSGALVLTVPLWRTRFAGKK